MTNAAAASPLQQARVRLRPTMQSDLDYVLTLERDPENLPYITPWEKIQHEAAIRFPDFRHFIIETGPELERGGFLILIGCRNQHQSIELKRMVVQTKHQGLAARRCGKSRRSRSTTWARTASGWTSRSATRARRRSTSARASCSRASCARR
jgi:hypothetical protein